MSPCPGAALLAAPLRGVWREVAPVAPACSGVPVVPAVVADGVPDVVPLVAPAVVPV